MVARLARPRVSALALLAALVGVFLLYLAVPNLVPVIRAARPGDGVPGTFTAQQLRCTRHPGHQACTWQGEFRPDDRARTRRQVTLYGGSGGLRVGSRTEARDIGRSGQVYRRAGTREWIPTAFLTTAGLALLLVGLRGCVKRASADRNRPAPRPGRTHPTEPRSEIQPHRS